MHDPVKVDQFAVVTARHEVGTWSIITLQVEDRIFLILKLCLTHLPVRLYDHICREMLCCGIFSPILQFCLC